MHEYGNETLTEISYLVLLALYQPNHGYGIMQFLNTHTEGRVKPGQAPCMVQSTSWRKKGGSR